MSSVNKYSSLGRLSMCLNNSLALYVESGEGLEVMNQRANIGSKQCLSLALVLGQVHIGKCNNGNEHQGLDLFALCKVVSRLAHVALLKIIF
jgi:hypothetical protein